VKSRVLLVISWVWAVTVGAYQWWGCAAFCKRQCFGLFIDICMTMAQWCGLFLYISEAGGPSPLKVILTHSLTYLDDTWRCCGWLKVNWAVCSSTVVWDTLCTSVDTIDCLYSCTALQPLYLHHTTTVLSQYISEHHRQPLYLHHTTTVLSADDWLRWCDYICCVCTTVVHQTSLLPTAVGCSYLIEWALNKYTVVPFMVFRS